LAGRDDFGGLDLRLGHHVGNPLFGRNQALPALLTCLESFGHLPLALEALAHQRGPDEPGREPDEQAETDGLHQQGEIDVHRCLWISPLASRYLSQAGISGVPNANSIAMPRPMMNDASMRPSSRNTFACSAGISSGWRAAP